MKTILALALLCLTFNARAATYMLLSQTNAFAAGITNLAKAYTDAHSGGGSTNLDNLTVTNDTRLFGPLYQGLGTIPYWLGDNSDGIISLHITDLGENPQNKLFLGAVDHNSQGTAMNIAYMHFIPDENDPGFQFRILCDTNFQGAIPSAGLYVNARMSGNEANMRLLNNLGVTNFHVADISGYAGLGTKSLTDDGTFKFFQPAFTTGHGVTNQANVVSANLSPGSNITFVTNANGQISIASTAGGGNVINSGASVVGMIPVYTDVSGTAVTPTNSVDLTGINVGTLYLSSMVANVVPVFDGNTNLVPSATSTNDLNAIAGKATVLGHYMGTDTNALLSALGGAPLAGATFTGSTLIGTTNIVEALAGKVSNVTYTSANAWYSTQELLTKSLVWATMGAQSAVTQNVVYVFPAYADRSYTISAVTWYFGTPEAGKFASIGLYDVSGNRLWYDKISTASTGSQSHAATGYTITPGHYYLTYTTDSSTVTFYGSIAGQSDVILLNASPGLAGVGAAANASTAGVPPTTLGAITQEYTVRQYPQVIFK